MLRRRRMLSRLSGWTREPKLTRSIEVQTGLGVSRFVGTRVEVTLWCCLMASLFDQTPTESWAVVTFYSGSFPAHTTIKKPGAFGDRRTQWASTGSKSAGQSLLHLDWSWLYLNWYLTVSRWIPNGSKSTYLRYGSIFPVCHSFINIEYIPKLVVKRYWHTYCVMTCDWTARGESGLAFQK